MSLEKVHCPLGNGTCPKTCPNHKGASSWTKAMGADFDPVQSRVAMIFADGLSPNVTAIDIARFTGRCPLEGKKAQ